MKLIHSGKVLKDGDEIGTCNIKPNDFLVVMISKTKKTVSNANAAPATPTASASTDVLITQQSSATPATSSAPTSSGEAASSFTTPDEFPTDVVHNLKSLGFPESEVFACLRASDGNPDLAVEFLMNGIPLNAATSVSSTREHSSSVSPGGSLEALRSHPQFNDLRRLVQTNPSTLQTVLAQIGQQQPDLLRAINANQAEFLQMMNESLSSIEVNASSVMPSNPPTPGISSSENLYSMDPAQFSALLSSMPPIELAAMAQMMGMSSEQLQQTAQMISAMPQEQVQNYINMAMTAQGVDARNMMRGVSADNNAGAQVLRLNEEEMAAVNRLAEMGFDRTEAAQAYLACDKNEALAANLLMDGGFGEGGAFSGEMDNDEDNEDMYD